MPTISRASCSSGLVLHSQCGFVVLGQSREELSSVFREVEHRSADCHSWLVHRRHGFYSGILCFNALQDWFFILSVDLSSWVRVEGILVRFSERSDMNQRVVTVDQFTATMASIQEALASLRQEIDSQ